jgi:hypothetical protein
MLKKELPQCGATSNIKPSIPRSLFFAIFIFFLLLKLLQWCYCWWYSVLYKNISNIAKIYESVIIEGNRIILPYTQHLELIYL